MDEEDQLPDSRRLGGEPTAPPSRADRAAPELSRSRRRRNRKAAVAEAPDPGRMAFTVPETAWSLNCSPNTVWTLIASGELKSFKLGRKRLVARADIEAFIVSGGAGEGIPT